MLNTTLKSHACPLARPGRDRGGSVMKGRSEGKERKGKGREIEMFDGKEREGRKDKKRDENINVMKEWRKETRQ